MHPPTADLDSLIGLFYDDPLQLGSFRLIEPSQMPPVYRRLLDHHDHMTISLEEFHRAPVQLRVARILDRPEAYARKLTLVRANDGRVVLCGIMRLKPALLPPDAMDEVRQHSRPLGHILIAHNVLREVERLSLWEVQPGPALRKQFGIDDHAPVYGRTALIYCNEQPAIELLEIVRA
jgi:chorismate-pyruvate lyase